MPIYEYQCKACQKNFDHLAKSMSQADADVPCPTCGSKKTSRKMSVFAVSGSVSGSGTQSAGGHQHSGMCGCGKVPGSCGMN